MSTPMKFYEENYQNRIEDAEYEVAMAVMPIAINVLGDDEGLDGPSDWVESLSWADLLLIHDRYDFEDIAEVEFVKWLMSKDKTAAAVVKYLSK